MNKTRQQKQTLQVIIMVDGVVDGTYLIKTKKIEIDSYIENLNTLTEQHFN